MSESGASSPAAGPGVTGYDEGDPGAPAAALRERGAHRFDPVRFRYIEALSRRAAAHSGAVRRTLDRRLDEALAAYGERYEKARSEAADAVAHLANRFPDAAEDLHRLQAGGDFGGLRRLGARLEGRSAGRLLADLVSDIDRQPAEHGAPADAATAAETAAPRAGPPAELKALRQFRSTWSQLSVERQLKRSLAKVPENPGPLNSHLLVLRSLQRMQAVSPAYLVRFISHVDALLWLEQASFTSGPESAKAARREGDRKRQAGRGKLG